MSWFYKRKAGGIAILLGLAVILSGCSEEGDAWEEFPKDGQTGGNTSTFQEMEADRKDDSLEVSRDANATAALERVPLTELPEYVFQTGDGKLLLLGDKMILMDMDTFGTEVCKETAELDFSFRDLRSCKFAASEDEYLVTGNYLQSTQEEAGIFSSSEEPQLMLIRLSKSLEILEVLDIGEAMGAKREIDKYIFIQNGRKLLCSSMEGFFLYDLETGMRTLYPLGEELRGIYSFGYIEAEDKILFAAFYDDGSQTDYQSVLGSMRLDGTELEYEKKQTHEWGEIWSFEDFALIEDGKWNGNGEKANVFYYGADGKIQERVLADEYAAVQASETGKYFAVQSRDWAEDGTSTGYTVRVYESGSGQPIKEISCPLSEIGENTMLCECIVNEETGAVYLLMCDRETEEDARLQAVKF